MKFYTILFDLDDTLHNRKLILEKFLYAFIRRYSDAIGNNDRQLIKKRLSKLIWMDIS